MDMVCHTMALTNSQGRYCLTVSTTCVETPCRNPGGIAEVGGGGGSLESTGSVSLSIDSGGLVDNTSIDGSTGEWSGVAWGSR